MKISNKILDVTISKRGAELKSVIKDGREYMWQADAKYWDGTSPILFPHVGGVPDGIYKINGEERKMLNHGFARGSEFEVIEAGDDYAVFVLRENAETLEMYPFKFDLFIKYELNENAITVSWTVVNNNDIVMPFAIGAHPGFNLCEGTNYFKLDTDKDINYFLVHPEGGCDNKTNHIWKNTGYIPLSEGMFDRGAYIIEGKQASRVAMCDSEKREYVSISFDTPLFALWHPRGENVPFVCIEPWHGRLHTHGFTGDFSEREYIVKLAPHEKFETSYKMEFK